MRILLDETHNNSINNLDRSINTKNNIDTSTNTINNIDIRTNNMNNRGIKRIVYKSIYHLDEYCHAFLTNNISRRTSINQGNYI